MGREVRRVAMDFAWPLRKTYEGFLMPDDLRPMECPRCGGTGSSHFGRLQHERWYGKAPFSPKEKGSTPFTPQDPHVRAIVSFKVMRDDQTRRYYEGATGATGERMVTREAQRMCRLWNAAWSNHLDQDDVDALVAGGRLTDFTHDRKPDGTMGPKDPPVRPSAADVNTWSIQGFGHDGINQHIVAGAEARRLGLETTCGACGGEGTAWRDEEHKRLHDAWEPSPPPEGDGWQMWETTSEGSPISPVKPTPEALARWLADTGASAMGGQGATYEEWLGMIGCGWAPTGMMSGGEVRSGVAGIAED